MADIPTVHERMAKVIAALSYIPKGRASGVNYEFRGIDAVMNHLHGILANNGLYLSPRVLDDWQVNMIPGTNDRQQTQALFRVCVDVYAEDGSMVTLGPGLAQSHDYGDKAVYQAQQNAVKYVLLEAFCIPTAEQDMDAREADAVPAGKPYDGYPGDNGEPAVASQKQVGLVKGLLKKLDEEKRAEVEAKTFEAYGIDDWKALPKSGASKVIDRLKELTEPEPQEAKA